MCGIVGLIDSTTSGLFAEDMKAFFGMLLINSLRGAHSTSYFGLPYLNSKKEDKIIINKVLGDPYNLFSSKAGIKAKEIYNNMFGSIIGHGRQATMGAVNLENAHPFEYKDILLVHNGTLRDMSCLENLLDNGKIPYTKEMTDSELITRCVASFGAKETFENIFGAWACVWFDKKNHMYYVIRNSQRPLSYYINGKQLYLASESSTLEWVKKYRNHAKNDINTFEIDTLYSIDPKTLKIEKEKFKPSYKTNHRYLIGNWSGNFVSPTHLENNYYNSGHVPTNRNRVENNEETVYKKVCQEYMEGDTIYFRIPDQANFRLFGNNLTDSMYYGCIIGDVPLISHAEVRGFDNKENFDFLRETYHAQNVYEAKVENIQQVNVFSMTSRVQYFVRVMLQPGSIKKCKSDILPIKNNNNEKKQYLVNNKMEVIENIEKVLKKGCCSCEKSMIQEQLKHSTMYGNNLFCPDCSINGSLTY